MKKPIVAFTFVFFFLFLSIPSFAYLPVSVNKSFTLGASDANTYRIHCMNFTTIDNQIHCIVTSYNYIYRFNSTGSLEYNCSFSAFGGYASALVNETQVLLVSATNAKFYDISAINTSATCANTTGFKSDCAYLSDLTYSSGIGNGNDRILFPRVVFNQTCTDTTDYPYYYTAAVRQIMLPNMSDNTTLYAVDRYSGVTNAFGDINYYSSGVLTGSYTSPNETWNVPYANAYGSLVKENATTTWLYYISTSGTTTKLYSMNFTALTAAVNASTIDGIYPIANLTISQAMNPTVQLDAFLDTELNGTVMWYVDNVFAGNQSITGPYYNDIYYSTQILAAGQHNWTALFIDSLGNKWGTNDTSPVNEEFFMQPTSAITTVGQSLANALGVDLDYGKMMLALLISAALSGALAYYVKWQLFLPSMIVCIFFFAVAGFFPAWFTLIFIVIGGILFAKFSGLVG